MNTILTDDRLTGRLHLGCYIDSLKKRAEAQADPTDQLFVMITNLQALTDNAKDLEKVSASVLEAAPDYLAVGLDPTKTTIFIRSQIPQLAELAMYYLNLVTMSRVHRNPTVKVEIEQKRFGEGVPTGFFIYPISQTADTTVSRANLVPVGEDQKPVLEQAQEIVHSSSQMYSEVLVGPEAVLPPKDMGRLPGVDGNGKMSKPLGNGIYLSDPAEVVRKKVMSMYTDLNHICIENPGQIEGNMVPTYLDVLGREKEHVEELKEHYRYGGLRDAKIERYLIDVLEEGFAPIRRRREELAKNSETIMEVLYKGSLVAEEVAAQALAEVKKAIGIQYF